MAKKTDEYIRTSFEFMIIGNLSSCSCIIANQDLGEFRFLSALVFSHDALVNLLTRILAKDPEKLHLKKKHRDEAISRAKKAIEDKSSEVIGRDYSYELTSIAPFSDINSLDFLLSNFYTSHGELQKKIPEDNWKELKKIRDELVHYRDFGSIMRSKVFMMIESATSMILEIMYLNYHFDESIKRKIETLILEIRSYLQ